jgi:hypothetical protein
MNVCKVLNVQIKTVIAVVTFEENFLLISPLVNKLF